MPGRSLLCFIEVSCSRHAGTVAFMFHRSELFMPRRDGRLSLPLRANVRVGPPAMSSSSRSSSQTAFLPL